MFSNVSVLLFKGRSHPVQVLSVRKWGHPVQGAWGSDHEPPAPSPPDRVKLRGRGRYCLVMVMGGRLVVNFVLR